MRRVENLRILSSPLGPVIGPLVMAGVKIKEEDEAKLKKIGVKDSKLLTSKQRKSMFSKIIKLADYEIIVIPVKKIDDALESESHNLNWLEADYTLDIIHKLKPEKAFLDSPSNNLKSYEAYLKERLKYDVKLVAEHKADMKYPVVGAASILAKVTRDNEIDKIKKELGMDFGSGYSSDPVTKEFVKRNWNKFPDIFRKSWATYKEFTKNKGQSKLAEFK